MGDPIAVEVLGNPPWWVPILVSAAVQFAAVWLAFILGARHASKLAQQQAAADAQVRADERRLAEAHSLQEARRQFLWEHKRILDDTLREVSSWASRLRTTDAFDITPTQTAELLTIDTMLQAVFPLHADTISVLLYEHHCYCSKTPIETRNADTLDAVIASLEPLVASRKKVARALGRMIGLQTQTDRHASSKSESPDANSEVHGAGEAH